MKTIGGNGPITADLLLQAEGELLDVRMLGVVCNVIDPNPEGGAVSRDELGIGKGRRPGIEGRSSATSSVCGSNASTDRATKGG